MGTLPLKTRVYTLLLVLVTVGAFAWAFVADGRSVSRHDVLVALVLFAMIFMADLFGISFPLTVVNFTVYVNAVLALAAALTLGPLHGALVVVAAEILSEAWARRSLVKAVVNVATYGLATLAAGAIYDAIATAGATPLHSPRNLAATAAASLAFTLVNSWALAIVVSPVLELSAVAVWRANYRGFYMQFATLPTLGSLVPILAQESPVAILLLIVPLIGPHMAAKGMRKVQEETQAAMASFADALERRDRYTHNHSIRVTQYVVQILDELPEVPFETKGTIRIAARIHDLGKVGTQDNALHKAGPLTPEEWEEMRQHPVIGAEIVDNLSMYKECVKIIRHHHERMDGKGYPDGIKGEDIPLGARIIAVADSFDAMTSDRSYRRAMPPHEALAELHRGSGTQFDPHIVETFDRAINRPVPVPEVQTDRRTWLRERLVHFRLAPAVTVVVSFLIAIIRHVIPPKS